MNYSHTASGGPVKRPPWVRLIPVFVVMPCIALVLSAVITWINLGWVDGFMSRWLIAFLTALPVLPLGLFTMMMLERRLKAQPKAMPDLIVGIFLALSTAIIMEILLASVVTFSNHGFGPDFISQWGLAFVRSLPFGLLIGLLMTFIVKPRLNRWMEAV